MRSQREKGPGDHEAVSQQAQEAGDGGEARQVLRVGQARLQPHRHTGEQGQRERTP